MYLERGLRAAGMSTGMYTSPHLKNWEERVCINGRQAPDDLLAAAIEAVLGVAGPEETFFDLLTAVAFWVFRAAKCEAWVVEVGLGGRLDSTNVLSPLAAAVVSLEREHTEVLGDNLVAIAREKAGIFKPGAELWTGLRSTDVGLEVLVARALECGSELKRLPDEHPIRADWPQALSSMQRNYALAQAMLQGLKQRDRRFLTAARELRDLPAECLNLPGRYEQRRTTDGRPIVLDLAHTPKSLQQVLSAFRSQWPNQHRGVILALRKDKNVAEVARALLPNPMGKETWWVTDAGNHPQSADPVELAPWFGAQVMKEGEFPEEPEVLLVTGSTYLVGEWRPQTTPQKP